jgi:dTDP-4-dehydrorhamnose 3,5-epimerase
MTTATASGWVMSRWSKVDAPFLGALFLITAFGIWATVPDTHGARVLLGAAVPLALGTTHLVGARLTSAGAFALAGLVVWIGATGGEARPASIIGAWASLGLLLILPIAMGRLRSYRVAFLLIGQGLFVFVTARIIGFGDDAASAILTTVLLYGLVLGVLRVVTSRAEATPGHGFLSEVFNRSTLAEHGIDVAVAQENHIHSTSVGTIRGLHFQLPPSSTAKLIRVITGAIFDVAVDLRVGSPTYGEHFSHVLSEDNWTQMYQPKGTAHGLCTLEADTRVAYVSTSAWSPSSDGGVRWDDPQLAIPWPVDHHDAIVSAKDRAQPLLDEIGTLFAYESL